MSKVVNIKINNQDIETIEGTTILDAAESAGIHIPNLCHLKGMKGIGACRLCLVEIEGLKTPITSCTTKVKEGMSINTNSPELEDIRKFIIDLILSIHPMDCMTCQKAGICRLQEYAFKYGIKESNYIRKRWNHAIDNKNPFIIRDPDYCIHCARCVRVCRSQGTNILDFMGRGISAKISTANDKLLQETNCTFCGSCVDVCPVNAFNDAIGENKDREWNLKKTETFCTICGDACAIEVSSHEGQIVRINSAYKNYEHKSYTCIYGRYGYEYLYDNKRITTPMIKKDGQLQESSWGEAIGLIKDNLYRSKGNTAFITNGSLLTEDALSLIDFANEVLSSKNIFTTADLYIDDELIPTKKSDIYDADLFIVAGLSTSQNKRMLPALDAIIRRTVKSGTPLVTIGDTSFSDIATISISGDVITGLKTLTSAICKDGYCSDKNITKYVEGIETTTESEEASKLFIKSSNPVVIAPPEFYSSASNLSVIKGFAIPAVYEANSIGLTLAGFEYSINDYHDMLKKKGFKTIFVIGNTTISQKPEDAFTVVHTTHLDDFSRQADVILPLTSSYETWGTIIDYTLTPKSIVPVIEPQGFVKTPREVFVMLADALGKEIKVPRESDIKRLMKTKTKQKGKVFEKNESLLIDPYSLLEALNSHIINSKRINWLKQIENSRNSE
ncbi:MAG: 2Fe-2S iron-sulfur cluster-binding protein [Thermodesulfovibrionales bacterium]|nr:2Fe-2S iron-sulfur cluster-binding protein [Thermodesulfovibrionales bacterium]